MSTAAALFRMGLGALVLLASAGVGEPVRAQGAPDIVWKVSGGYGVDDVAYAADGQRVASAARDEVLLMDAADGSAIDIFAGHSDALLSVDLSPDGELMAAGYIVSGYPPSGVMNLWDIAGHSVLYDWGGAYVDFSPRGDYIASGGGGRYLFLHSCSSGQEMWYAYTGTYILDVAYSPDGDVIATAGSDNAVQLWDAVTGGHLRTLTGHMDDVNCIAFSPDGYFIASGAGGFDDPGESTVRLWRVSDGALLETMDGHGYWVDDLAYSPGGQFIVTSGRDGLNPINAKIKFWRVSDGELRRYYDAEVSTGVMGIVYSPDGGRFLYGRSDSDIVLANNPLVMPAASMELRPHDPPLIIPPAGGSFDFNGLVANNESSPLTLDIWIKVLLPDGSPYGPVQGPLTVTLPAGGSGSRDLTQDVPGAAPPGTYTYMACAGIFPEDVWSSDSFEFTKSAAD